MFLFHFFVSNKLFECEDIYIICRRWGNRDVGYSIQEATLQVGNTSLQLSIITNNKSNLIMPFLVQNYTKKNWLKNANLH